MADVNFNIVTEIETLASAKGWHSAYTFDDFYRNLASTQDLTDGEPILVYDYQIVPTYVNGSIAEMTFQCLIMLGRKFDPDGSHSNLDETPLQKNINRLDELTLLLMSFIKELSGCGADLDIKVDRYTVQPNVYDTSIDFAIADKANFTI